MEASAKVVPSRRPSGVAMQPWPSRPCVDTEIWQAYMGLPKGDSNSAQVGISQSSYCLRMASQYPSSLPYLGASRQSEWMSSYRSMFSFLICSPME